MAEELIIRISADVDQARAGLNSVAESSEKTAQAVLKIPSATDKATAGLNAIGTSANKVPTAINNVTTATTKFNTQAAKIGPVTNSANLALLNTGRIFQDLPFGILGVTNNINPLVESFQRLVKETGSTGAALKSLLSGLSGAGGLGLAFSVITGALTFLTVGLSAFTRGLSTNKEQVDKNKAAFDALADSAKEMADRIDGLVSSIQFLNRLGSINIQITGLPKLLDVQAQAIAAQQKVVDLSDEVTKAVNLLTEAQRLNTAGTEAQIKAERDAAANLEDVQKKLTEARREATLAQRQTTLQRVEDQKEANKKQLDDLKDFTGKIISLGKSLQDELKDFQFERIIDIDSLQEQLRKARLIIQQFRIPTFKIGIDLDINPPKLLSQLEKPEFQKSIETLIQKVQAKLKEALSKPSDLEILQKAKLKIDTDLQIDPTRILESIQKQVDFILSDEEILAVAKLAISLNIDEGKLAKEINEIKNFIPDKLQKKLEIAVEVGDVKTIGLLQSLANMNKNISDAINRTIEQINIEGLSSIGEAIGQALSGGDIQEAFRKFGDSLGSLIQDLGKQIIKFGIEALALKKALKVIFANPVAAIVAGVALVAIGTALKNLIGSGLQGFAAGGRPPKDKPSIVGEKGWEIFVPDTAGRIIPHHEAVRMTSVRENNSIREYFAHRQIAESIKAIETRLTNVVYKISEQSDRTNKALVERFTTHSEAINKFVQTSIAATNERTIEVIKYFIKDKSETDSTKEILSNYKLLVSDSIKNVFDSKDKFNQSKEYFDKVSNTLSKVVTSAASKELSGSYIKLVNDKVSNVYKDFYGVVKERQTTIDRGGDTIINSDEFKRIIPKNQFEKTISSTFSDFVEKVATKTDKLTEAFSNNYKEFYSTVTNQLKEFHYKTSNEKQFNTLRDSNVFESILKNTKESYSSKIESLVERFTNNSEKQTVSSRLETITSTLKSFTDKLKISITNNIFNTSSEKLSIEKLHTMFKIPKFEFGGLAFGPTLGILGEGFGISRSNPEVVAPLNQLKSILGGEFALSVDMNGKFDLGNGILLSVNRAMKTHLRTTGRTGL